MQAIVKSGNQQFKVESGDFIRVPLRKEEVKSKVQLDVLALIDGEASLLKQDELKKASVTALLVRHGLHKKVLVFKKKRRKGYRRTRGHRQSFTELQIVEIKSASGKSSSKPVKKAANKPAASKQVKKVASASKATTKKPVKKLASKQAKPKKKDS